MREQFEEWVSLLIKIRLKRNKWAKRTLWRVRDRDNKAVPIWVIGTRLPSESLIVAKIMDVIEEKNGSKTHNVICCTVI